MIFVVVPAYNEQVRLPACLASLSNQERKDFKVILVDNSSTDDTPNVARQLAGTLNLDLTVVFEPVKGVGAAADTGFRTAISAGATHLLRIDADAVARSDWVKNSVRALDSGLDVAAGLVRASEDSMWTRASFVVAFAAASAFGRLRPGNRSKFYTGPYVMLSGNNVACTPRAYLSSGGWPRRPSPTDRDFTNALRRSGFKVHRVRSMVVRASTRRLRQYGLLRTARWYLTAQPVETADPR